MMNRTALVTGADKGIGTQICKQLAEYGYTVFLGCRELTNGQQAIERMCSPGLVIYPIVIDLLRPETFLQAADVIREKAGCLDALVNNAGIALDWQFQVDVVPVDLIRKTFEVNFFGMVEFTQTMLPLLRESDAGRIVNQSSRLGSLTLQSSRGTDMDSLKPFAYDTTKTAINSFTVHLAYALRETSIKVNSAHPGVVQTDINISVTRNANSVGMLNPQQGARTAVQLATLPLDGPTGGFFHLGERLPW